MGLLTLLACMISLQAAQAQPSSVLEEELLSNNGMSCYWQADHLYLVGNWQGNVQEIVITNRNGHEVFRTASISGVISLPSLAAGTYTVRFYGLEYLGAQDIVVT